MIASLNRDPINYQETMTSKEKECWKKTVKDELDSMQSNNVWKLINIPRVMLDGKKANIIDS